MISHQIQTGESGILEIRDFTDDPDDMTVQFWIRTNNNVSMEQMPWAFSFDQEMVGGWRSYHLDMWLTIPGEGVDTKWHRIHTVYAGDAEQSVTLHLGNTNTAQLGGPTDLTANLASYILDLDGVVDLKVDGNWVKAVPYVRHEGVWRVSQPLARTPSGWKPIS